MSRRTGGALPRGLPPGRAAPAPPHPGTGPARDVASGAGTWRARCGSIASGPPIRRGRRRSRCLTLVFPSGLRDPDLPSRRAATAAARSTGRSLPAMARVAGTYYTARPRFRHEPPFPQRGTRSGRRLDLEPASFRRRVEREAKDTAIILVPARCIGGRRSEDGRTTDPAPAGGRAGVWPTLEGTSSGDGHAKGCAGGRDAARPAGETGRTVDAGGVEDVSASTSSPGPDGASGSPAGSPSAGRRSSA